jgi:hypothetical protein
MRWKETFCSTSRSLSSIRVETHGTAVKCLELRTSRLILTYKIHPENYLGSHYVRLRMEITFFFT